MKRLPGILSFCFVMTGLIASGTSDKSPDSIILKDYASQTEHDTTGLVGYLKVDPFNITIIPPSSGVQFFRNGILFLSNTKDEGKMLPKHVSFGTNEAYTALLRDSSLGLHMLFSPGTSFSYPCEATTFSSDFKTMYYTMIAKKEKREKIYMAEYLSDTRGDAGWVMNAKPLEFCTGNYIYTHPALSSDGKMMVFASDMDGSLGGLDLFVVKKEGEKWSKPENLGKSVNTPMDECYPFLDQDNNLYYSSKGLPGLGGFDIFTSRFDGEKWDKPVNLSGRINSEEDDIAFSIEKVEGKIAFYTRRQQTHLDNIMLYKVSLKKDMADKKPLTISYIYNGKFVEKASLLAAKTSELSKASERPKNTEPEKTVMAESVIPPQPEVKKEVKAPEKKPVQEPVSKTSSPDSKAVIIKLTSPLPDEFKNVVVYRVQFLSTGSPRKEKQVLVNGVPYKTFEYLYLGAYRYTIGEFTTLAPARELQNICRKSGFPQAFVAAFKNETRSIDLTSFK